MRALGVLLLFLIVGIGAFMSLSDSSERATSSNPDSSERATSSNPDSSERATSSNPAGDVSLEDYRPINPSPSSKAKIHHGTIQHGSPLMPYIPRLPPPSPPPFQPKHGGFP